MKVTFLTRISVMSLAVLGCVLVVSSQPVGQQSGMWPKHGIIPAQVSLSQVQEFKDAASIHLNDIQRNLGTENQQSKIHSIATKTIYTDVFIEKVIIWTDAISVGSATGANAAGKKISPAALAALYYTFDQGIDLIARNSKSTATASITPSLIVGNIKPTDMGMTGPQFKQMVITYVDNHPMRFWNEARVGLASGR